jgi:hypothetical protein
MNQLKSLVGIEVSEMKNQISESQNQIREKAMRLMRLIRKEQEEGVLDAAAAEGYLTEFNLLANDLRILNEANLIEAVESVCDDLSITILMADD